ncbi:DUF4290 domain-containing protein [Capnocytophaga canimorsus]|uniref:DUF4290 domain-containing protein n=2 Tax=Capnocytophaga canimorsus TaxID=28188 RepID=F9YQ26_CAPCC|nr:DUF4290 domain-containing protein [Capnocytophaga canimorsus]AEK23445.1 Conserved hypothetical protein [Capnocytophaga canimorsus Cc5]ATA76463.1 DUF4290 domain-containing protein [Capnocytophaga canimorsus]ATA91096.1 DUF4290 domain-containing protein [Capnocytophaga canimorsus]AWL77886.1 DUF4290 domain-containing protein [Capnocytophaga canimorsus]AYW36489.1 DUF4290 domain-containing protein [Capnocytophaga canimorsus]
MEYNTERSPLIIPEYGRHIQKMIEKAVQIENREERNNTARGIIGVMGNLNPHLRDVPDFQHKLWDQLFIMSNFELDVDSPFEKPTPEVLSKRPDRLSYPQNFPKYRFYGNNIKKMIDVCVSWEEGEMRTALAYAIANHMKKSYLNWNKDTVEDEIIFQHLHELSNGKINLSITEEDLSTPKEFTQRKTYFQKKKNFSPKNNNWKKKQNHSS